MSKDIKQEILEFIMPVIKDCYMQHTEETNKRIYDVQDWTKHRIEQLEYNSSPKIQSYEMYLAQLIYATNAGVNMSGEIVVTLEEYKKELGL